jgi:hypothetical protein
MTLRLSLGLCGARDSAGVLKLITEKTVAQVSNDFRAALFRLNARLDRTFSLAEAGQSCY